MADHGELEYATAEGNDLPAHEASYEGFTHFVVIGTVLVLTIVVGLAIGGVVGNWPIAAAAMIVGIIVAAFAGWTGARWPGVVVLVLSLIALLLTAHG
ncbi:MAG: aa3-type cytochrome c oxidase subunit IV [Xanthobacteraceae bacterium]|nr:aa3-type cytochrome c oxidase subunit IV [Xanthobacteraceae bacterium]